MASIVFFIGGPQVGFHASMADMLAATHRVSVVANAGTHRILEQNFPCLVPLIQATPSPLAIPDDQLVSECLAREEKYGEFFSTIASYDRNMGKGYITSIDRHPDTARVSWPQAKKLRSVLDEFLYYEQLFDAVRPDFVISPHNGKIKSLVTRHYEGVTLAIIGARIGKRYLWADDEYLQSAALEQRARFYVQSPSEDLDLAGAEYTETAVATARYAELGFSYRVAAVDAARLIRKGLIGQSRIWASKIYRHRGRRKPRTGYHPFGWLPSVIMKAVNYKLFVREGVLPGALAGQRQVFFPLHMEPEATLLSMSPEFNNSLELIIWVSKSIPADTVLVVKENPFSFGVRSKSFYDNLRKIGNVVLADPRIHSWDWIRKADVIATITGTVASEAVFFGKPVLSFGKHQVVNVLPTARYAHDFDSTREGLAELLGGTLGSADFDVAKAALHRALDDIAFALPGYENNFHSAERQPELARTAIDKIAELYPDRFLA